MGGDTDGRGRGTAIGFALFWIYVLLYFGFIAVVVFRPGVLAARPLGIGRAHV